VRRYSSTRRSRIRLFGEAGAAEDDHVLAAFGLARGDLLRERAPGELRVAPLDVEALREDQLGERVHQLRHRAVRARPALGHVLEGAAAEDDETDLAEQLQVDAVALVAVVGPVVGREPVERVVAVGGEAVQGDRHVEEQPAAAVPAHDATR
jgi:hypothetical protein